MSFKEKKISNYKISMNQVRLKKRCFVCGKLNQNHTRLEAIYCAENWDKAIICDG